MEDKEAMRDGLYINKYNISKTTAPDVPVEGVVMEWKDAKARKAIKVWAEVMRDAGYKKVYEDVMLKLDGYKEEVIDG